MPSLFKRRKPKAFAELTFKSRVDQFWKWYAGVAERHREAISNRRIRDLTDVTSDHVNELGAGLAWVYGPGPNENGHSLTLSGEGDFHRQLLAEYWRTRAPELTGWTFYSSRQPSPNPGNGLIRVAENEFDPKAFWLTPSVDLEREHVDLTVWHPLFPQLDDGTRWTILYLFLDEALGEIGTQSWIGKIELNDSQLTKALPLAELPAFIEDVRTEHGWKKGALRESWTGYECEAQFPDLPRGDIFVGTTIGLVLLNEFSDADGQLTNPLPDTGADYIYVQFDARFLPRGKEVGKRAEIEDALGADLEAQASGWHLGGALGHQHGYIDLLIFDGEESLEIVRDTLQRLKLPKGTSINYFAHEKRGHRLLI